MLKPNPRTVALSILLESVIYLYEITFLAIINFRYMQCEYSILEVISHSCELH